jgi:hypothetical protein
LSVSKGGREREGVGVLGKEGVIVREGGGGRREEEIIMDTHQAMIVLNDLLHSLRWAGHLAGLVDRLAGLVGLLTVWAGC